jgi:ribosomal protein L37AE/L43A
VSVGPCPYPRCAGSDGHAVLTGAGVCEDCRRRVQRDLHATPTLYVQMSLGLPHGGTADINDPVSGTPTPPAPLRIALLDAMSQLARAVTTWHTVVADAANLAPLAAGPVREGWAIDRAARILAARVELACATAPDLAAQLARDVNYGRRLIGTTPLVHRLAAPCPECGLRALVRRDGAQVVYCRGCHATWDEALYHHLTRVLAAEAIGDTPR